MDWCHIKKGAFKVESRSHQVCLLLEFFFGIYFQLHRRKERDWGVAKLVRHKVLILACAGSSPATPAKPSFDVSGIRSGRIKDIFGERT